MALNKLVTILLLLNFYTTVIAENELRLKKVLALSRHNVRTPLTNKLERITPNEWTKWDDDVGYLTKKGVLLEGYMGKYFSEWLKKENLLTKTCPEENSVYIYSNTKQRTKETAKAFAKTAFKNCNFTVNFKNMTGMDPTFHPIIHNTTEAFINKLLEQMQKKIDQTDLKESYLELNKILNIKNSKMCIEDGLCNLATDRTEIVYQVGDELNVAGPLAIGNSVLDVFIMSLYEGKPLKQVAWGKLTDTKQWELLSLITKANLDVRFNFARNSKDIVGPLLKVIAKNLLKLDERKFTLLVGHDSNLSPVTNALGIKYFQLPNQYELFPIGGKVVFQKWTDGLKDYLKVEYVYQSVNQLREGIPLDIDNPPERVILELEGCEMDQRDLCPWDDFVEILEEFL